MELDRFTQITKLFINRMKSLVKAEFLSAHGLTDKGLKREKNEDAFLMIETDRTGFNVRQSGMLFAVADGMGGHAAGETASNMALEGLKNYYKVSESENGAPHQILKKVIQAADESILKQAGQYPELSGMGTTISALLLQKKKCFIAHVGDSRIYRLRNYSFEQLTRDHSKVQELVDMGRLTLEEAKTHPLKHVITQAVGTPKGYKNIFLRKETIVPGDRFLICSDGLHDMVSDEKIKSAMAYARSPEETCRRLVKSALDNGGKDNVTIIAIFT